MYNPSKNWFPSAWTMSNDNDLSSPELSQNVWEKVREILKQVSTLLEQHIKELKTVPASVIFVSKKNSNKLPWTCSEITGKPHHSNSQCSIPVPFETLEEEPLATFLEVVNRSAEICLSFCYIWHAQVHISWVWSMFPNGQLLKRVFNLWRETFTNIPFLKRRRQDG